MQVCLPLPVSESYHGIFDGLDSIIAAQYLIHLYFFVLVLHTPPACQYFFLLGKMLMVM
jgi:hypothetical protein